MSEPYVGEIRWLTFSRTPQGWLPCDGSVQPISNFEILYTLLGTTYGGNGVTTFAVPDLRGRAPLHQGTGMGLTPRVLGQSGGTENVSLTPSQLGGHTHAMVANLAAATATTPVTNLTVAAVVAPDTFYTSGNVGTASATLSPQSIGNSGGSLPHENCAPTLPINACICFAGIFPSQS